MATACRPRIYAPWETKLIKPGSVVKGTHCMLFTQPVPRSAEFADVHGACTPDPQWMAMFLFCMEALRRIQCTESKHTTLLVEQVVTEEAFREAIARGRCEVTPARPPLAWRYWVVFKTVDAYIQFVGAFEQMLEDGAVAAKKRQGTRKGNIPYVDPSSWFAISGSADMIRGLQHSRDIPGGADVIKLDPGADRTAKNHLLNLQSTELLHVDGACSAQTSRTYIDRPTRHDGFGAGDDEFGPEITFRVPYFQAGSRTGSSLPGVNPFVAQYHSPPWGRDTNAFRRMAYLGTATPPRLLERHLVNRATGPVQVEAIRKHAESDSLDQYLIANPEVNDPRDAGIVEGFPDAEGARLSRSAAMSPEFAQNEELASDRLAQLRRSTEPSADEVEDDSQIRSYVLKMQGPIRFLEQADIPDDVPANYRRLAEEGVSVRRTLDSPEGTWASRLFTDCDSVSSLVRRISFVLERHVGLHVAQVTVANWVLLGVMVPLLGPAPRAHTAMVGQPQAGKSWLMDVLRRVIPSAFSSVDYSSLKATLVDMYGPRGIELTDEITTSERPEGEKTRLSSGIERGVRAKVVTDTNGNSSIKREEFQSIYNTTWIGSGNELPSADKRTDAAALCSRMAMIFCANISGLFQSGKPRCHDAALKSLRLLLTGNSMRVGYIWAAGCPVGSSDMMEVFQSYLRAKGKPAIPARELARLTAAAIGAMSLRMGIETRGMEGIEVDEHIIRNAYVRTEDIVVAYQIQSAVAQTHAVDLVRKALKRLVVIAIERDADGNITGAGVEMDTKGERAIMSVPLTRQWRERLCATVCALAKQEDRKMVPADDVMQNALNDLTGGASPLLLECSKSESRTALGIDLKQIGPIYTAAETAILRFLHKACTRLDYTKIQYPNETHVIFGASLVEDMKNPFPTCRKWGKEIEKMWVATTKRISAKDVQESIARLIASGAIVMDRVIECKYAKSVEGGRPSKLKPGHDVLSAETVRKNQAAVVRICASSEADGSSLIKDFARDTDPSLDGRTFNGVPQMFSDSVAASTGKGTFTVKRDPGKANVALPDRNYVAPDTDDLPPPPPGGESIFDGSSPTIDASTANERARRVHLRRVFPNIRFDESAAGRLSAPPGDPPAHQLLLAPAREKRRLEHSCDGVPGTNGDTVSEPASGKRRTVELDESDLEDELDWEAPLVDENSMGAWDMA